MQYWHTRSRTSSSTQSTIVSPLIPHETYGVAPTLRERCPHRNTCLQNRLGFFFLRRCSLHQPRPPHPTVHTRDPHQQSRPYGCLQRQHPTSKHPDTSSVHTSHQSKRFRVPLCGAANWVSPADAFLNNTNAHTSTPRPIQHWCITAPITTTNNHNKSRPTKSPPTVSPAEHHPLYPPPL